MAFPFLLLQQILLFLSVFQPVTAQELQFERSSGQAVLRPIDLDRPPLLPESSGTCSYWLENIGHNGVAPFASSGYKVFRNVKDYGAKGDGIHDDTAAINLAISDGGRCAPCQCPASTTTPALVYFPPGTYKISSSIIDYYYTQMVGNPNCLPILQATSDFKGAAVIDADPYICPGGDQPYFNTNVFFRQIRNFILDMTQIPLTQGTWGIHWPTAQSTSLQNIVFNMSDADGTQHVGVFSENGSGGFISDLVFYGGLNASRWGNQQFTMRNLTYYNAVRAINQLWDWGWTYKGISIFNCTIGLDMSAINVTNLNQAVGSVILIDSLMKDTKIGILTAHSATSLPVTGGSLILENVQIENVQAAVQGPTGVALAGTSSVASISAWGEGHAYSSSGPNVFEGPISPVSRSSNLLSGDAYYQKSKPQYETYSSSQILSVRNQGAVGDGSTDDTTALQNAIFEAIDKDMILFVDAGLYRITSTLYVPAGSKLVGEAYSVVLASGGFFSDMNDPQPVVMVGKPGEQGTVEWSDMIVSTQGSTPGAVLIEWNLAQDETGPSGMWDVHTRIGGYQGSNLQVSECPKTPAVATPPAPVNANCIAAYMSMHITPFASGLYMENVWLWVADHDIDDPGQAQTTVYAGRGLYIESCTGPLWLYGTAAEHHTLYQYQLFNTSNIFMGQIQTESAYFQPNPPATMPFTPLAALNDPVFPPGCIGTPGGKNPCDGFGLRIIDSQNVSIYGAGLYSFFSNYDQNCLVTVDCQSSAFSIEGSNVQNLNVYNLNTIGSQSMITRRGASLASALDNVNVQPVDTIAIFRG